MGVRTAIVGAGGHMGRRYLKILSDLGDAELVALVDVDDEAAGRLSEAYRIPAFGTVDELLAAVDDLDAAVVATPDQLHREASEKLAAGGCTCWSRNHWQLRWRTPRRSPGRPSGRG